MFTSLSNVPVRTALLAGARDRSPIEERQCRSLLGLFETCDALSHTLKRELNRHAHSESGFRVLAYLVCHSAGIVTPKNVCEDLALSRNTATAILGRLELSGLISHQRSTENRSAMGICLTAAGRRSFSSAVSQSLASISRLMSSLDLSDLDDLDLACARLREISTQFSNS